MAGVLVVGFGNPLRSDDGLGWHIARQVSREYERDKVESIALHQLTPEVAELASRAELILFVDASCRGEAGTAHCEQIYPAEGESQGSHEFTPAAVLQLAEDLYGRAPKAYLLTIAGECFEAGESLLAAVVGGIPALMEKIRELIAEFELAQKASGDSR
jgi:hydrogenase maturation protease